VRIENYADFVAALMDIGFSMATTNSDNIIALCAYDYQFDAAASHYASVGENIRWHTGDPQTDPWEWRMRVLNERDDIAYAKLFFKKGGYITREWYPYFLAARRGGMDFDDEYADGAISHYAKRIYEAIRANGALPIHRLKPLIGFSREDQSKFARGLVELQMKMYITTCGSQQKLTKMGEEYGWSSNVFCTTEEFFADAVFERANEIGETEAAERITERILRFNPNADQKKIVKFIVG